ncbi:hypothetical protein PN465_09585 [Nodularia spumigena CS-584]|uniref:Uncharacterized protein n=1 Tax=Nodularia spumigena UHCC 0060 TaxID=3110300 RepID=A0ABU5UNJ9_NODSP|nr:hypothetical protein [Nodularia spumigena]AHJ28713.1 hypothetical protein NSP_23820 [Nodularia spumigena CCY9414]MDB9382473.1 hypothetical protein [Nodularia spumigena CS-584]MEA5525086.1 hypothetical protein [Nodularia spumigena UHCC 0143]MEA5555123.1 hypothetical protein [Nodularia spumigena CH309]MEA5607847.1 hypothetical protein [Nodularia spumigena UHCC 0060]
MKRLIFGSLSMLVISTAVLPPVKANQIETQQKGLTNNNNTSQILIAQNQTASGMLMPTSNDGTPNGITKEKWLSANAKVSASPISNSRGSYRVTLKASNLVPNGLYTFWWVNKKVIGMDMGPAGGIPSNEFRADNSGNVTTTITVPTNNNYQMLGIAYHADNKTYGQMPGEFGKVTFTHLMGKFPKLQ